MLKQFDRALLVGQWIRNDIDDNGDTFVERADFHVDGSFEFCFMTLSASGDVIEQVIELGDWGLVGDIHFTTTKNEVVDDKVYSADLSHPDNYHAYKVTALTADSFAYQHIVTKDAFILKRVIDNIGHC